MALCVDDATLSCFMRPVKMTWAESVALLTKYLTTKINIYEHCNFLYFVFLVDSLNQYVKYIHDL